jgi:hypothetical protein
VRTVSEIVGYGYSWEVVSKVLRLIQGHMFEDMSKSNNNNNNNWRLEGHYSAPTASSQCVFGLPHGLAAGVNTHHQLFKG